jgi:hypothetical protein
MMLTTGTSRAKTSSPQSPYHQYGSFTGFAFYPTLHSVVSIIDNGRNYK